MFTLTNATQIGTFVRQARARRLMTQADLASCIGVTREWVNRLEKGLLENPGLSQILAAFKVLDLQLEMGLLEVDRRVPTSVPYDELGDLYVDEPVFETAPSKHR